MVFEFSVSYEFRLYVYVFWTYGWRIKIKLKLQYLYHADEIYHFMDQHNFEDIAISKDVIGDNYKFLKDNLEVTVYSYEREIFNVVLPNFIDLKVEHSEPGVRGDTAKAAYKTATLETGATVGIPLFIKPGDVIRIDTRTGTYVGRV